MRPKKGYRQRPSIPIREHALDRFRQHWPVAAYMYDSEIKLLLSEQVLDAIGRDDVIVAPGGIFAPINILGEDGYAVIFNQEVRTVMPSSYCPEVNTVRQKRNVTK